MPKGFDFLREYKVKNEMVWEYACSDVVFNEKEIVNLTITEYYRTRPGREQITNDLIYELVKRLKNERKMKPEPKKKPTWPDVFVKKRMPYKDKKYKLVFWFKRGTDDHLWIKNCHQQD